MSVIPPTPMIGSLPPVARATYLTTSVERRRRGAPLSPPSSATRANTPGRASIVFVATNPSSPWSATTASTASIWAKPRSGAVVRHHRKHGVNLGKTEIRRDLDEDRDARPAGRRGAPLVRPDDRGEKLPKAGFVLKLPEARRVGAGDVEHDIVRVVRQQREARQIIVRRSVDLGDPRLAEVHSQGNPPLSGRRMPS